VFRDQFEKEELNKLKQE